MSNELKNTDLYKTFTDEHATDDHEPAVSLAPGTVLGEKFELLELVGRGGMGVVWKARDLVGNRLVALKFVPNDLKYYETEMKRVRESFGKVHALHHPSICPLYGLEDGGRHLGYYLVMRYLEGETLDAFVSRANPKQKKLPLDRVTAILSRVAKALDYAHDNDVIHRDIKPSNIFLVKTGKGTEVQVIDFGLADEIRSSLGRVSRAGIDISGTRPYMAPEQWRGQRQTAATDQYSLAVVAYELSAGHLPFEGNDAEILRLAVMQETPELIPGLSGRANLVLRKALSKDAGDRFGSCREFLKSLAAPEKNAAAAPPIIVETQTGVDMPRRRVPARRKDSFHRYLWTIIGFSASGLLAVFLFGFVFYSGPGTPRGRKQEKARPVSVTSPAPSPAKVDPVVPVIVTKKDDDRFPGEPAPAKPAAPVLVPGVAFAATAPFPVISDENDRHDEAGKDDFTDEIALLTETALEDAARFARFEPKDAVRHLQLVRMKILNENELDEGRRAKHLERIDVKIREFEAATPAGNARKKDVPTKIGEMVESVLKDADEFEGFDPEQVVQNIKLTMAMVRDSTDLDAAVRKEYLDKLGERLRELGSIRINPSPFVDQVVAERRILTKKIADLIEQTLDEADRLAISDPKSALQNLKLARVMIQNDTSLTPEDRKTSLDKLDRKIRDVQFQVHLEQLEHESSSQ